MIKLLSRLALVRWAACWLAHRSIGQIGLVLALAVGAIAVAQQGRAWWQAEGGDQVTAELPGQFDAMMRARFRTLRPDPRIVIIDIDERSLALMAPEFGRWPWPRDTLAAVVERVESQQPAALVLDIQLADPDKLQPGGDAALADTFTRTRRTYVPVVRLDPATDAKSQLRLAQLPGLWEAAPGASASDAASRTVAAIPPFMDVVVGSQRMGLANASPDADSVLRHYDYLESLDDTQGAEGPRLRSLPARVARDLQPALAIPDQPVLLRWPAAKHRYPTVSFADVFADTQTRQSKRPADEFKGKLVFIGATAPSLFDLKATPVRAVHPGVEILAVATDNLLNGRWLAVVHPAMALGVTLLLVSAFAWLALRLGYERAGLLTVAVPGTLLAVSYLSLNIGRTFWDFTPAAGLALTFFASLKACALLREWHWTGALDALHQRATANDPVWVLAHASPPDARDLSVEEDEAWFDLLRTHAPDGRLLQWTDWRDTTPRREWGRLAQVAWRLRHAGSPTQAQALAQALNGGLTPFSGRCIIIETTADALDWALGASAAAVLEAPAQQAQLSTPS
jgi:CHASE2 domain-containing sensor protein